MKLAPTVLVAGLLLSEVDWQTAAAPIFKEVAHQIGYDSKQAAAAGDAVYNSLEALFSALRGLDPLKPIMHPDVAEVLGTIEDQGGLVSKLVSWVAKAVVKYMYTSDIANNMPYVGELIRHANSEIAPEYQSALLRIEHELGLDSVN